MNQIEPVRNTIAVYSGELTCKCSLSLIYPNGIDERVGRKLKMREILVLERGGHPKIKNNIISSKPSESVKKEPTGAGRQRTPRRAVAAAKSGLEEGRNSTSTNHWFFQDEFQVLAYCRVRQSDWSFKSVFATFDDDANADHVERHEA